MAAVRVRRPSAAAPPKPKPLDVGDSVGFSMTAALKITGKGEFWVKCGADTTVRIGEDPDDTVGRLHNFVLDNLQDQIKELTS